MLAFTVVTGATTIDQFLRSNALRGCIQVAYDDGQYTPEAYREAATVVHLRTVIYTCRGNPMFEPTFALLVPVEHVRGIDATIKQGPAIQPPLTYDSVVGAKFSLQATFGMTLF